MLLRFFLVFFTVITSSTTNATTLSKFEDVELLRAKITSHVNSHFKTVYGEKKFDRDVRVTVSHLDPRLKLAHCGKDIQFDIVRPAHRSRNITVKTRCVDTKRWSIYVPVSLEVYADVIVAARNLARGVVIEENDLITRRMDTSSLPLGHIIDKQRLIGMELKRATRDGSYLLLSAITQPKIVNKGDSVVLESKQSSLVVAAKGIALSNGELGEQIKVKNNQSQRVIDALVSGPGRVTVVSR